MNGSIELNDTLLDRVAGGLESTTLECPDGSSPAINLDTDARTCPNDGAIKVTTTSTKGTTTTTTVPSGTIFPTKK